MAASSISSSAPSHVRSPAWRLWALTAALFALRMVAAGLVPLTEDEAYYRLWSIHLRFGYYDHPPMIAWWIAAGRMLLGDTALGVRLLAVLGGLVSTILVYDLGARAGDGRQAWRAALWFNAMPLIGLGGFLATPDAPETLFWTATLWALSRLEAGRGRWWLAAGAFAGLALISKYSGFFLVAGVAVWLAASSEGRRQLARPWPWLAAVIAALVFAPNVGWNAEHGWITFAKQFGRVEANGLRPGYVVEAIVAQALLVSPFMVPFVVEGFARLRPGGTAPPEPVRLAALTAVPLIAYMAVHALHARVQGNWPAPIYPGLAVLAAWAAGLAGQKGAFAALKRLVAPFGYALSVLALAHAAFPQTDVFGRRDPTTQIRGWAELARKVEEVRAATKAGWIGTNSYGALSQLLANGVERVAILQLSERDRYSFEPAPPRLGPAPGLVFDLDRRLSADRLALCFDQVRDLGAVYRQSNGLRIKLYRFYLVSGPRFDLVRTGCPALERSGANAAR